MSCVLEDVLSGKTPVTPAEIAHLIKRPEIQRCGDGIFLCKFSNTLLICAVADTLKKFAVIAWSVSSEVLEDLCEWGCGHFDLQEIVAQWNLCRQCKYGALLLPEKAPYHAIIRSRLPTEEKRLFAIAFVDDTVRKHGLIRNAEDECTKARVATRFASSPHTFSTRISLTISKRTKRHTVHDLVHILKGTYQSVHALVKFDSISRGASLQYIDSSRDERA